MKFGARQVAWHPPSVLDYLISEGAKDRDRPWLRRTTGGVLVAIAIAAIAGGVLVDLLGGMLDFN